VLGKLFDRSLCVRATFLRNGDGRESYDPVAAINEQQCFDIHFGVFIAAYIALFFTSLSGAIDRCYRVPAKARAASCTELLRPGADLRQSHQDRRQFVRSSYA
jgi:hypothetical protein